MSLTPCVSPQCKNYINQYSEIAVQMMMHMVGGRERLLALLFNLTLGDSREFWKAYGLVPRFYLPVLTCARTSPF